MTPSTFRRKSTPLGIAHETLGDLASLPGPHLTLQTERQPLQWWLPPLTSRLLPMLFPVPGTHLCFPPLKVYLLVLSFSKSVTFSRGPFPVHHVTCFPMFPRIPLSPHPCSAHSHVHQPGWELFSHVPIASTGPGLGAQKFPVNSGWTPSHQLPGLTCEVSTSKKL